MLPFAFAHSGAARALCRNITLAVLLLTSPLVAQVGTSGPVLQPNQAGAGSVQVDEYRVGPGDVLTIDVFRLENLSRKVRVSKDGRISLPLLGGFTIAGVTVEDAEQRIVSMLVERELLKDPQVSIFVDEYNSRGISIQGAVEVPGEYQVIGRRSLMEMLGQAGGLADSDASRAGEAIFVVRNNVDGSQETFKIDVARLYEGDVSLNIGLVPGDIVTIPYAKTFRVYVTGAVVSPGAVDYLSSEGISVLQAVTSAGGLTERAKPGRVFVVRRGSDGSQERIRVDLKKIEKGAAQDLLLQRNDTVVVGEWFF